jgi:excisionase family DNA binding protein
MSAQNQLLTPAELAERLKVSEETVKRKARAGQIPALHLGSQVLRFDYDEVLNAMKGARAAG